jgi:L-lactate dehydrogenase (cytochrome)
VLLDGGVRRASHVVKAVALGATACLIGRPHLWGLTVAGEAGVAQVLEIFRRDIDRVLALGGWDGIARVERGALVPMLSAIGSPRQSGPAELRPPRRAVAS